MHGPMVTDPTQICYTDVHQVHHSFTPMPCIVVLVCSHYSIRFVFMGFWTLTMMVYSQFESWATSAASGLNDHTPCSILLVRWPTVSCDKIFKESAYQRKITLYDDFLPVPNSSLTRYLIPKCIFFYSISETWYISSQWGCTSPLYSDRTHSKPTFTLISSFGLSIFQQTVHALQHSWSRLLLPTVARATAADLTCVRVKFQHC